MLGSLILYRKGMRIMMFQLSGFYCKSYTLNTLIEIIVGIKLEYSLLFGFKYHKHVKCYPTI